MAHDKNLMNRRYDLTGNEIPRVVKFYFIYKLTRIGNYGGGPGFKFLGIAFLVHSFGKLFALGLIFFEPWIRKWLFKIKQFRKH